jgi:Carboxypeptidase regulatory-like domain
MRIVKLTRLLGARCSRQGTASAVPPPARKAALAAEASRSHSLTLLRMYDINDGELSMFRNALATSRTFIQLGALLFVASISSCNFPVQMGSIEGHISGASGISLSVESQVPAIPNLNITVKNISTSEMRTTRTDFAGNFKIEGIPPGRYQVSYAASPFEQQIHTANVRAGETVGGSTRMLIGRDPNEVVDISGCPARPVGGPSTSDLGNVEIQMRRTACRGLCPAYSVHCLETVESSITVTSTFLLWEQGAIASIRPLLLN